MAFFDLTNPENLKNLKDGLYSSKYFFILSGKEIFLHEDFSFPSKDEFLEILEKAKGEKGTNAFFENFGFENSKDENHENDNHRNKNPGNPENKKTESKNHENAAGFSAILLENALEHDDFPSRNLKKISVQSVFAKGTEEEAFLSARARSILKWRKSMKFCQECASPLHDSGTFSARECEKCGKTYFPRIEPCIITLIQNGDKVLLARHRNRNVDSFACIAGFIEAGENAEHAVLREVKEETGLNVKNPCYKGSQSWPFPDQLMLAFTAEYESGEIRVQEDELSEAKWFSKDEIPDDTKPGSAAWRLLHNKF